MAQLCRPRRPEIKGEPQSHATVLCITNAGEGVDGRHTAELRKNVPYSTTLGLRAPKPGSAKTFRAGEGKAKGRTRPSRPGHQAPWPLPASSPSHGRPGFTLTPRLHHRISKDSSRRLERLSAAFLPLEKQPWSQGLSSGVDAAARLDCLAPHPKR